jgi:N-acetylmuramoyl-L-alanine amidase
MSAPWPYPTEDGHHPEELPSKPTWECPDKTCQCQAPTGKRDKLEFSVLLVDEHGASMPGARCRVHCNGVIVNEDEPYANGDGWITAVVAHAPESVLVEWAPLEMPDEPRYPFQKRYFVDLREDDPDEASRRRLHNLGFSDFFTMEENVCDFQEEYGYDVTGKLDDIRGDLEDFHDDPCLPETTGEDDDAVAGSGSALGFVGDKPKKPTRKKAPRKKRPEPEGKGHKKTGGGGKKPGKGPAKPKPPRVVVNVFSFFSKGMTAPMRSGARPRKQRWGAGDAHPVKDAELRIFDGAGKLQAQVPMTKIKANGQAILDLTKLADATYTLLLAPPAGHELRSRVSNDTLATGTERQKLIGSMAGPGDSFTGDAVGHTRFRLLEVTIGVKAGKLDVATLPADMFVTLAPGVTVSHGGILLENPTTLWIDYKPDFVQIKSQGPRGTVNRPGTTTPLSSSLFIHLHHTEGDTPGGTIDEFISTKAKGAHYLVDFDGFAIKLTNEDRTASHAGRAHWYDLDSSKVGNTVAHFNDLSVGIEQVNRKGDAFPSAQLAGASFLVGNLRSSLSTNANNVLADAETAINHHDKQKTKSLGRKVDCPGAGYDWTVLENAGNATKPATGAAVPHKRYDDIFVKTPGAAISGSSSATAIAGLQQTLAELGYFVNRNKKLDNATKQAVKAFQNRYFSGPGRAAQLALVSGVGADLTTVTRMHEVLDARAGFTYA